MINAVFISLYLFCITVICQPNETDSTGLFPSDSLLTSEQDSVDVMALFQVQINEAKMRDSLGEIKSKSYESYNKKVLSDTIKVEEAEIISSPEQSTLAFLKDWIINKYSLLAIFSILLLSAVFVRRKRANENKRFRKEFKEKIKSVREEIFFPEADTGLKMVRNNLMTTPESELFEKTITAKARELKIGKGELILAARIKSFHMAQLSLTKE